MNRKNYRPLFVLFFLGAALFISCKKEEPPVAEDSLCDEQEAVQPPPGYQLNLVGAVQKDSAEVLNFQMLNDQVGYALAGLYPGEFVAVFKTTDGAKTWQQLNVPRVSSPLSMHFTDASTGYVTLFDATGCLTDCLDKCVVLKTTDGGATWQTLEYSDILGRLQHLQADSEGRLFASLARDEGFTMMYSDDGAESWDTLYPTLPHSFITSAFSFLLHDGVLYVSTDDGNLDVISRDGAYLRTIETGQSSVMSLNIAEGQTFWVESTDALVRSGNGGLSWTEIADCPVSVIDFPSATEAWLVKNRSSCPSFTLHTNDVLAYSNDGGLTWQEGPESSYLLFRYNDSHKWGPNDYLLVISNHFYQLHVQ